MTSAHQLLPDEVLMMIFNHYIDHNKQKQIHFSGIYKEFKDNFKILFINKTFLGLYAPRVIPTKIHAIIPLCTTRYIKTFEDFEEYMKTTYSAYNSDPREGKILLESRNTINRYGFNFDKQREYKSALKHYEQSCSADYEFLNLEYKSGKSYYSEKYEKESGKPIVLKNLDSIMIFCTRIINNEKSIMRQYIKSFTIDLLFLDEFQTTRLSKDTLFSSILSKYVRHHDYLSIHPKPFKALGNVFSNNIYASTSGVQENITSFDRYINHVMERFPPSRYNYDMNEMLGVWTSNQIMDQHTMKLKYELELRTSVDEAAWPYFKQLSIYSCFGQFFHDESNLRLNFAKSGSKNEMRESLEEEMFYSFYFTGRFTRVKRNAFRDVENPGLRHLNSYLTSGQIETCFNSNYRYAQVVKLPTTDYMSTSNVENLVEQVVKATTINSPKHADTSLVVFSSKSKPENYSNRKAFELVKPKIIVINKPAIDEESVQLK